MELKFLFREPLVMLRFVSVRERRTKIDWALELEDLLRTLRLRGVRPERDAVDCASVGDPAHAQARQLAQYRRMQIERDEPAVPERSSDRQP